MDTEIEGVHRDSTNLSRASSADRNNVYPCISLFFFFLLSSSSSSSFFFLFLFFGGGGPMAPHTLERFIGKVDVVYRIAKKCSPP